MILSPAAEIAHVVPGDPAGPEDKPSVGIELRPPLPRRQEGLLEEFLDVRGVRDKARDVAVDLMLFADQGPHETVVRQSRHSPSSTRQIVRTVSESRRSNVNSHHSIVARSRNLPPALVDLRQIPKTGAKTGCSRQYGCRAREPCHKEEQQMKNLSHVSTWTCVIAALMALNFWPSRVSAGELQNLLDKSQAFGALPRVTHTPVFRVEPFEPVQHRKEAQGKQWWYICDGNERIGLITTWLNHVELFRFFPDVAKGAKYEIPEVYHWANLIGAKLELRMHGYHTQLPAIGSFKLTFTKERGDSLEFRTEQTTRAATRAATNIDWCGTSAWATCCTSRATLPCPSRRRSSSTTCWPGALLNRAMLTNAGRKRFAGGLRTAGLRSSITTPSTLRWTTFRRAASSVS